MPQRNPMDPPGGPTEERRAFVIQDHVAKARAALDTLNVHMAVLRAIGCTVVLEGWVHGSDPDKPGTATNLDTFHLGVRDTRFF
jgi:hypothetical protein